MSKNILRLLLLTLIVGLVVSYVQFDLGQYLTLEYAKQQRDALQAFYAQHPWQTISGFMAVYIVVTASSIPGATILTLIGGGVLGLGAGSIAISFASTIGATLAFIVSRFMLRDFVQEKFKDKLFAVNKGIEKDGAFYLFSLRLIPLFPFFVINLVMGLTTIKAWKFYIVSQIGMLPATIVYVNAGSQLAQLDSLTGIVSPSLLFSFVLIGLFPLIAKKMLDSIKSRKAFRGYKKPSKFDFNIIVIGAGSGGLVSAYIAAAVKAKVALIEKHKMGGDCLNTGCVPSKALIRSAKMLSYAKRATEFGFDKTDVVFSFSAVMERVRRVITTVEPHDSIERYSGLGVEVIQGEAKLISPWQVEVNGQTLSAKNIIVATGARPFVPDIPGLTDVDYVTSDTIWNLRQQPRRLLVIGGGPIGSELAQCFQRLGSEVTLVQRDERILPREDVDVSELIRARFESEGMQVLTSHEVVRLEKRGEYSVCFCAFGGETREIEFDMALVALGREANVSGFGLEELGVRLTERKTIAADDFLRTNFPNIYVCGDVTGPYQFTHTASHQAWYAAVNALFSPFKSFAVDNSVIPWATYSDPEVATVGLNEQEAKRQGIPYELTRYAIDDLDRAIADEEAHGLVKVLTVPGKDKILGVTIVGAHAGDLIAEYVLAMKHRLGLNKILGTIHIYPTLAEANKYVAGNWKKAHKPESLLKWVEKFHAWRRG